MQDLGLQTAHRAECSCPLPIPNRSALLSEDEEFLPLRDRPDRSPDQGTPQLGASLLEIARERRWAMLLSHRQDLENPFDARSPPPIGCSALSYGCEHNRIGDGVYEIALASQNYAPPAACRRGNRIAVAVHVDSGSKSESSARAPDVGLASDSGRHSGRSATSRWARRRH